MDTKLIKELLNYDPLTGIVIWKVSRKGTSGKGNEAGTLTSKGYRDVCINGKKYGLHRLAYVLMDEIVPDNVDHINGIKSDNRWLNLRPSTVRKNAFNQKAGWALSSYKNVYYDPRSNKKWFVRITRADGSKFNAGYYFTAEEANEIAIKLRMKEHGEFFHY